MPATNASFQKNSNTSLIAETIWKNPGITRAELSSKLGLYRSTVTNIVSYLLQCGIVEEGELLASTALGGRKATCLKIKDSFGCVIGIDIQPYGSRYVLLGAGGKCLYEGSTKIEKESFLEILDASTKTAFSHASSLRLPVLAVSYSLPGVVDTTQGILLSSNPLGVHEPVPVKEIICRDYDCTVVVDNDANCVAMVDIFEGKLGSGANALVIKSEHHDEARALHEEIGMGVGMGIVIGGRLYRGSHFAAGEFISRSWKDSREHQTGLAEDILLNTLTDDEAWKQWMDDTFLTIAPLVSIMDIESILLHGTSFIDKERVDSYLRDPNSIFSRVLDKTGCTYEIGDCEKNVSAKGAALRFLHNLYTTGAIGDESEGFAFDWDDFVAAVAAKRR